MQVENAIIMAAGTSSRFAPLSYEKHKAMTVVRGEILIERQIRQLKEAGIKKIIVVTGYKAEQFEYLTAKYGVRLTFNPDYLTRNNNASIWAVREYLGNSFICSADNYFLSNPFESEVDQAFYAAEYADGETAEWCMTEDDNGFINSVTIGGAHAWYMLGHTFWSRSFTEKFLRVLEDEYDRPGTADMLWEAIYLEHLDLLKMKIRRYAPGTIYEFDTLDELREFDSSYIQDTRCEILKRIARELGIEEKDILHAVSMKGSTTEAIGFEFDSPKGHYAYQYNTGILRKRE